MKRKTIVGFTIFCMFITYSMAHEVKEKDSWYSSDIIFNVINVPSNYTLSVQSDAGVEYEKIDELAHNTKGIQVLTCKEASPDNEWCEVHYMKNNKHILGWVSKKNLSSSYDLDISKYYDSSRNLRSIDTEYNFLTKNILYDKLGTVRRVRYSDNSDITGYQWHGLYQVFYTSGVLMLNAEYDNGSLIGVSKIYFESGAPQLTLHYDDETAQILFANVYKEDGTKKKVTEKDQLDMLSKWFLKKRDSVELEMDLHNYEQ